MSALFVKLAVSYHQDPKMLDLEDERAELLYVRGLTYCKTHLTDGVIHRRALASFAPFADEIAPAELAAMLVATGAWQEHPKGWIVPAWLAHNKASTEIRTPTRGAELAHIRHHVNTGRPSDDCPFCQANPQVAAGDAGTQCGDACGDALPEPEPEPEPEPTTTTPSSDYDSAPADPAAPVVVDQPTTLRAIRLVAEAQAERGAKTNPTGFAHAAKARMANPEDPDRQRIDSELAAGRSPTDIAAGWHTAPAGYPSVDHAAQERPRLTEVKPDKTPRPPKAVGLAGAAAARAALRRRSEVVPS